MGDGTNNIHFGKWDGVDALAPGAYGKASVQMTDWMWKKAIEKIDGPDVKSINYVDLGAGNGSAARSICEGDERVHATCINLTPSQNHENTQRTEKEGLLARIAVQEGLCCSFLLIYACDFVPNEVFVEREKKKKMLQISFAVTCGARQLAGRAPSPPHTQCREN